jgi:hypothetical protein
MYELFIILMLLALLFVGAQAVLGLRLNTSSIPGPYDAELLLEVAAGVTKVATYNGATLDLGSGYAPGGIGQPAAACLMVTDLETTDSSNDYQAVLQESANGTDFTDAGPTISVAAIGGISIPGFVSKRYVRVKLTIAGDTPSITYAANLVPLGSVG